MAIGCKDSGLRKWHVFILISVSLSFIIWIYMRSPINALNAKIARAFAAHTNIIGYDTCGTGQNCDSTLYTGEKTEFYDKDAWNLCTDRPPVDSRFWPTVGNGHMATVVHSANVFMNGLYNGNGTESSRARIPAVTSINLSTISLPLVSKSYCLHMDEGIYKENYIGAHWSVELRIFAHRIISRLLVTEIRIVTDGKQGDLQIAIEVNRGNRSEDIDFVNGTSGLNNTSYIFGKTNIPETSTSGKVPVHVYYTDVPAKVTVNVGEAVSTKRLFLASFSPYQEEAKEAFIRGVNLHKTGMLESGHVHGWNAVWEAGRIDISGNTDLASATYSALYYILSSIPAVEETSWPFIGLSPGDLGHGIKHEGYGGHLFWDQDTWMFPPVLVLNAKLGKTLVNTRIRTLDAAQHYALQRKYKGAMYPWESAFSGSDVRWEEGLTVADDAGEWRNKLLSRRRYDEGLNVCPSADCSKYEVHVTGDVAMAFQQYLMMTSDTDILKNGRLKEAVIGIAQFWKSRVTYNRSRDLYEILDVMPPDEWNFPVNNSVYTNSIARASLLLPKYALGLLGEDAPKDYETIATKLYVPVDDVKQYHPEYDGYCLSTEVKQADVILLGYPLLVNMTRQQRWNDLTLYEKVTPSGPAMTWGMFCIGWLEFHNEEKASKLFNKQLNNKQQPFNVWTEYDDGTGATNFITGQGGFLQSVLFGYAGIRIHSSHIAVDCTPIPETTSFRIKNLDYLNASLDVTCDVNTTCITVVHEDNTHLYMVAVRDGTTIPLHVHVTTCVNRQTINITNACTKVEELSVMSLICLLIYMLCDLI